MFAINDYYPGCYYELVFTFFTICVMSLMYLDIVFHSHMNGPSCKVSNEFEFNYVLLHMHLYQPVLHSDPPVLIF